MFDKLCHQFSKHVQLTEGELAICSSYFNFKKYRRRQYLLQEGQVNLYTSFILKGVTRMYEVDDKGQEHVVKFAMENWWAGDLYSYLTELPTTYNIDCLDDTEVLQIRKGNLELLYQQVPKMERYFRIIIQNAFVASTKRVSATLVKSAADRYYEFILKYPQLEQRLPNHQIASYLGITPQSLSRIRSQAIQKN